MIDWKHHYWKYAERCNGRGAMLGVIGIITYIIACK